MARSTYVNPRSARYAAARGDGWYDLSIARVFALLLLAVPLVAGYWLVRGGAFSSGADAGTSESVLAKQVASINPKSLLSEDTRRFLPPPVAALPPETNAGPPVPNAGDAGAGSPAAREKVKVANTGGVGAVLRAAPQTGQRVASLRDGQSLEIMERQNVGEDEWLKVRTPEGAEGWIYGRLVAPGG